MQSLLQYHMMSVLSCCIYSFVNGKSQFVFQMQH